MIINKQVQISFVKELDIEINLSDVLRELLRMTSPISKAESRKAISAALSVLCGIPDGIIVTQINDNERVLIIKKLEEQIKRYSTLRPKLRVKRKEV